jgi:Methyltransferase domain
MNDSQVAGWGSLYYGVLTKVINDNQYKKVAEVGIGYGTHAKYVLKTTNVETLYLVDPMQYYPNDSFADDILRCVSVAPNNHFNEFCDLIRQELAPWSSRYTWFRTPSLSITNDQIPDGHLDCVFVDGDHSYEAVRKDLPFWWAKVRAGGHMLGDDYWMDGVARAVHEFASDYGLTPEFLTAPGKDYKIFSFKKPVA